MDDRTVGRVLRALRHRLGWRRHDLSIRSGVSRSVISDLEAGRLGPHAVEGLRAVTASLRATLSISVTVPGGDLRRLLDADHARLQDHWKRVLELHRWTVLVEVTFNHYGERGSIDLLVWQPGLRILLVTEIKTVIVDVQDLLATLDRKRRVAPTLVAARGWRPRAVIPALFVADGTTARRRIAEHASLFDAFDIRGRAAIAWLRRPTSSGQLPTGLLCFTKLPPAGSGDRRRAGRQRVRVSAVDPRSKSGSSAGRDGSRTA